jgi:tousled-like kinase
VNTLRIAHSFIGVCCRLLKRLRDEEGSRFQGQPLLHQRYVLLALLGRGGFSEVHKAYDIASLKFVAVKVSGWLAFSLDSL